ncbi:MAG: hypothetical protein CVU56_05630 [Deltaproteobacteria bacterium HGW-Deltaproteobacteria-14]|nr:MAG: hypothetical protein CVU56_05630 [Deltaproteobacteria bacterium HGW-Deltaproteobacteria-14]
MGVAELAQEGEGEELPLREGVDELVAAVAIGRVDVLGQILGAAIEADRQGPLLARAQRQRQR